MKDRIESAQDFITWARDVNTTINAKRRCDLQDVFARSDSKALLSMFLDSENEKQLLTFAICKCQGEEVAYRFMKSWARKQAQICIDQEAANIDAEYKKLADERMEFTRTVRAAGETEKKLIDLEREIDQYKASNARLMTICSGHICRIEELSTELNNVCAELVKMRTFKDTLRSILTAEQIAA